MKLDTTPSVILVIGVNGVGKTTTIGKLAARFKSEGKRLFSAPPILFVPQLLNSLMFGPSVLIPTSLSTRKAQTPPRSYSTR